MKYFCLIKERKRGLETNVYFKADNMTNYYLWIAITNSTEYSNVQGQLIDLLYIRFN